VPPFISSGRGKILLETVVVRMTVIHLLHNWISMATFGPRHRRSSSSCYYRFAWLSQLPITESEVTQQTFLWRPGTIQFPGFNYRRVSFTDPNIKLYTELPTCSSAKWRKEEEWNKWGRKPTKRTSCRWCQSSCCYRTFPGGLVEPDGGSSKDINRWRTKSPSGQDIFGCAFLWPSPDQRRQFRILYGRCRGRGNCCGCIGWNGRSLRGCFCNLVKGKRI
jgi:hypothetical protein